MLAIHHEKVKYGDIVYIEFLAEKRNRFILQSDGFTLENQSYVESEKLDLSTKGLYLKDFENNLFVIFPTMQDDFLSHKTILDEKITQLNQRLEMAQDLIDDMARKNDINTIISTFQATKREVYLENEKLLKKIGTPIKFGDNFILIHSKSQMFVSRCELETASNKEKSRLVLTDYYSDNCLFLFYSYNDYENKADYVFSNQNIYISKRERNLWANNQFLFFSPILGEERVSKGFRVKSETQKYTLNFTEDREKAQPFQIKVFSNYIDPSSANLSFSNPIWISCQSADKYLIIKPAGDEKDTSEPSTSPNQSFNEEKDNKILPYSISFAPIDREKTINNIFGLFSIEQINDERNGEIKSNNSANDDILLKSIDLSMPPYIEYNKKIRFRHVATKKYLSFTSKPIYMTSQKIKIAPLKNIKTQGCLRLKDKPDEDCVWIFMESYKIMDRDKYERSKEEGMSLQKKRFVQHSKFLASQHKTFAEKEKQNDINNNNNNNNLTSTDPIEENTQNSNSDPIVKKKEILRIFHMNSQKFLSFEDIINENFDTFEPDDPFHNITLTKLPNDADLIRLIPSNENQSWEIHLILYFSGIFSSLISNCVKNDIRQLVKNEDRGNSNAMIKEKEDDVDVTNNEMNKDISLKKRREENNKYLKMIGKDYTDRPKDALVSTEENLANLKKNWMDLRQCFENLRDFCMNDFSRRFDITASAGKPVFYRQEFLFDQGFLEKTIYFLSNAKNLGEAHSQYMKLNEQNSLKMVHAQQSIQRTNVSPARRVSNVKKLSLNDGINNLPTANRLNSKKALTQVNARVTPTGKSESQSSPIGELFREMILCITRSFEFISAMCKSNQNNREYIFKRREIFWEYLLNYREAAECLINIIKDDETYMSEIIKENIKSHTTNVPKGNTLFKSRQNVNRGGAQKEISGTIHLAKHNIIESLINYLNFESQTYDIHTMSMLSKLMKSKSKGVTSNQEYILNALVKEKKDNFMLKITPKYNETSFLVVYKTEENTYQKVNLDELCRSKNILSDYDKNVVLYLATQLNLYADMCYGRNYVCIEKVRELFPLDHLIYHICNIELFEEILSGLINILNYVYIDIDPHAPQIYPSMIKIVNNNLTIDRMNKIPIKTDIPLDKLNLILCISLFLLYNIKYGKILVNSSNINLIYNLIQFRLYENVEYEEGKKKECNTNINMDKAIHNLKEEVKNAIQSGEKSLMIAMASSSTPLDKVRNKETGGVELSSLAPQSFFEKIGYKFVEFNYDQEIGSEFLIFVLDNINEFFLDKVIIENIDTNMENKNIIAQTLKAINKPDMLTQNNMNYLMKILIEIKQILTSGNSKKFDTRNILKLSTFTVASGKKKIYVPIIKQIAKVIDFILNIKKEDMINKILENFLIASKGIMTDIFKQQQNYITSSIYEICEQEFSKRKIFEQVMMDNEYYLYQIFIQMMFNDDYKKNSHQINSENEIENVSELLSDKKLHLKSERSINFENEYLNSIAFKTLQDLIIRVFEVNVDENLTKILVKLFARIHSQRKEIIDCIKNVRLLYGNRELKKFKNCDRLIKKLSKKAETTEIWMQIDEIQVDEEMIKEERDKERDILADPITKTMKISNIITGHNDTDVIQKLNNPRKKEKFTKVIRDIKLIVAMFYKKRSKNVYKCDEKVKLLQTICFSLQLDEILFSLLREICQVYPNSENEKDFETSKAKNSKFKIYKKMLNELIKNIFKLLKCMIHNSQNFQENIKANIMSYKYFFYLFKLGYLSLLCEFISKNENFALENAQFIFGVIVNEMKPDKLTELYKQFKLADTIIAESKDEQNDQSSPSPQKSPPSNKRNQQSYYNTMIIKNKYKQKAYEYQEEFEEDFSQACKILKLVNFFMKKMKEDKYINIIIRNYEDILKHFSTSNIAKNFKKFTFKCDVSMEIMRKKLKIFHQLAKMGFQLIRINDKLRALVRKLFQMPRLEENMLSLELDLTAEMLTEFFSSEQIKQEKKLEEKVGMIVEEKDRGEVNIKSINLPGKVNKDEYLISRFKAYYKTKYYSFVLYYRTSQEIQRIKTQNKINFFFEILEKDIKKYNEILKELKKYYPDKSHFLKTFKKNAYKYFFLGFFPLIHELAALIRIQLFKSKREFLDFIKELRDVIKNLKIIFKDLISDESGSECYTKILSYITHNKKDFQDLFYDFKHDSSSTSPVDQPKIDNLYNMQSKYWKTLSIKKHPEKKGVHEWMNYINISSKRKKTKVGVDDILKDPLNSARGLKEKEPHQNEINDIAPKQNEDIKTAFVIAFTEDFIIRIENFKNTKKYIEKEIRILAKNLKSKINYHHIMLNYVNNSNTSTLENMGDSNTMEYSSESSQYQNFHLMNIFLKFIQENYISSKYYPQITFIIQLFANFMEVEPMFLQSTTEDISSNFYLKEKVSELSGLFLLHCQNLFLNNGSVEVFLKIVCESNQLFNQNIFPSILQFFIHALEGGNSKAQEKFYQLFRFFPNSDNLFYYIRSLFDVDIYKNLSNDVSMKDPKRDYFNRDFIIDLLRYLQLLTENHFQDLQLYLRDQTSNKVSYNFITILVDYMHMLLNKLGQIHEASQNLDRYTTELYYKRIIATLETICEFLQGPCKLNQETLINSKIIEIFDKILRETEYTEVFDQNNKNKIQDLIQYQNDSYSDNSNSFSESDNPDDIPITQLKHIQKKLFYLLTDYEKSLLIYKIGLLLLAIIEGRKTKDDVIKKIIRDFDYKLIFDKLSEIHIKIKKIKKMEFFLYSDKIDELDEADNKKVIVEAGFNLYVFITSLYLMETDDSEFKKYSNMFIQDNYSDSRFKNKSGKFDKENIYEGPLRFSSLKNSMQFYQENCLKIEIIKDDQVYRVYCPKLNFFKNFTEEMMKSFRAKANRTSIQTKLNSILGEKEILYLTVKQLYNLELIFKKLGPLHYLFTYPAVFQRISLVFGILMNILILLGYTAQHADDSDNVDPLKNLHLFSLPEQTSRYIFLTLGSLVVFFSGLIFTEFLTRRAPILYRKILTNYHKDLFDQKAKSMSELEIRRIEHILTIDGCSDFWKKVQIYFQLIVNVKVLYALGYMGFAILGLSLHYFFFCFHLIEVINTQPVLKNVLKAVYKPRLQLMYIFIFFLVLEYFYSLVIFNFFYDVMPENSCASVFICLASVYTNTFTSSGNLGSFIDKWNNRQNANTKGEVSRYVLDISFTIIMVWLVFQMVSGLIVDTFQSLRKQEEQLDYDSKNICFICGLERETIEKYYIGKYGFSKHLDDHNLASYFLYMFYLKEKNPSELSGIESYINQMIEQESILWMPIGKCHRIEEWKLLHRLNLE